MENCKDKLVIRLMKVSEFEFWSNLSIFDYSKDLEKNYLYSKEKSLEEAQKSYLKILDAGFYTECNFFRICEFENIPAGYIWFRFENNEAFLYDIMVLNEFQGKGIAKDLLNYFIREVKQWGASEIELRVSPDNTRAINMYKNLGFRITGYDMSLNI